MANMIPDYIERQYLSPPDFPDPDSQCEGCGEPYWEEELAYIDGYGYLCKDCIEDIDYYNRPDMREDYMITDCEKNGESDLWAALKNWPALDLYEAISKGDEALADNITEYYCDTSTHQDYVRERL